MNADATDEGQWQPPLYSPSAKMIPVTGAGTFSAVSAAKQPSSEEPFSQLVRV